MLEDKLSELNNTIPEFDDIDYTKMKIINQLDNEQTKKHKKLVLRPIFTIIISFVIASSLLSLFLLIRPDIDDDDDIPEDPSGDKIDEIYLLEQERRSKLYSHSKKNYYTDYLLSLDEDESEYTKYLIAQAKKQEDSKEVEDVYYEVTIDYKNGWAPYKIIVKKGEYIYPEVFSYTGHYFVGWFVDEVILDGAYEITKDTYIYAKWNVLETCTIGTEKYDYYQVVDGVFIVKAYLDEKEIIEVPTYLNDLKVVGIEGAAYSAYYHNNQNITTKIIISEYVREVKAVAFSGYKKLTEVYFPKSLDVLYNNVFDSAHIEKIVIDEQNPFYEVIDNCLIDKRTNTLIKGCKNSIIPEGVKIIERRAFGNVEGLTTITIPDSVIQINEDAFENCIDLEVIIIPNSVKIINQCILENCTNLKEIYLGIDVEKIYDNAFMGCGNLEKVNIPEGNPYYETVEGCLIEKATDTLLYGAGNITKIPDGVKIIASNAFYKNKNIETLEIGSSVIEIKSAAFMDCVNLKKVIIDDSVTKIGSYSFSGCSALEEIRLPSEVEMFGSSIFYECEKLVEVTLPKGVTKIYSYTFDRCKSLERVHIQDNITEIWHNAFNGCSKLEFFDLSNVEIYGDWAMAGCSKLTTLDLANTKEIGAWAFRGCSGLTEVEIPTTLEKIGNQAFENCRNLIIYVKDEQLKETWDTNCFVGVNFVLGAPDRYYLDDFIFIKKEDNTLELVSYKGNLETVEIPEVVEEITVTSIGERVFYYNRTLKSIIMPDTIEVIKKEAFSECSNLNNVTMPKYLKEIGEMSFWQCHSLTNLKLNSRVKKIGVSAFGGCDIYSIILPSSLEEIGSYAFSSNYHLVEVFNLSQIEITLEGSYGDGSVAENALQIFTGYVKETSIVETSDGFVYYHNKSTESVTLINYLGNSHFLELPMYVTLENSNGELKDYHYEIGSYAFYKNKIVTKVIIPSSITSISDYAFEQCINLTSIVIPKSITSIGKGAFGGCNHIYEIYNLSSLEITKGSSDYGYISYNAKHIYSTLEIESKVVDGNNGFIYYIDDDASYIVAYHGIDSNVVLPTDIYGKEYYIGPDLFKNNETIESIEMSSNVIGILSSAFSGCINIKKINIPQSVKIIESFSFYRSGIIDIIFEDTEGWYYSDQYGNITIIDVTLSKEIANKLISGSVRLYDLINE